MVLWQLLSHGVLDSNTLRHLYEPSHEPWSSPLVVKWLVKVSHSWAAQGSTALATMSHTTGRGGCHEP
ncbi:hypothetical protein H5410_004841 [Solanum commersonii]|uniref:Uncharacterized protein n=1 Tax=Solanum commersonii TaxID=4109 RepID=A0A9J6A6D7_SOLCO|nr:hypothetical protein H5410_004841 [Solanum commersonii]